MVIKGKYRATIEIDITIEEKDISPNMMPYDDIKAAVENNFTGMITEVVNDEIDLDRFGSINVKQNEAKVWKE